jgi:hypothetical protein
MHDRITHGDTELSCTWLGHDRYLFLYQLAQAPADRVGDRASRVSDARHRQQHRSRRRQVPAPPNDRNISHRF